MLIPDKDIEVNKSSIVCFSNKLKLKNVWRWLNNSKKISSEKAVLRPHSFIGFLELSRPDGKLDWVVYKQFPGIRGELQGGVLEGFDLFFG